MIDTKVKEAHNYIQNLGLSFNKQFVSNFKYLPYWNNILIENNIRKFVKLNNNVKNFEKFLKWRFSRIYEVKMQK